MSTTFLGSSSLARKTEARVEKDLVPVRHVFNTWLATGIWPDEPGSRRSRKSTMHAKDNSGAEPSGEVVYLEPVRPNQEDSWRAPKQKQLYKHKGRGHSPEISIKRERNKPPVNEPWCWRTA